MSNKPPALKGVGYSYMLTADDWESNTDPMAHDGDAGQPVAPPPPSRHGRLSRQSAARGAADTTERQWAVRDVGSDAVRSRNVACKIAAHEAIFRLSGIVTA